MDKEEMGIAQMAAWGAVMSAAIAGGIWLGNLQTVQSAHNAMPAHMSAGRLIDSANQTAAVLNTSLAHLKSDVDQIEIKLDRIELMVYELRYGPSVKGGK